MKYLELKRINAPYEEVFRQAIGRVVDSGWYLQGRAVTDFEQAYADYIGTQYCVSCANGLDALTLMLRAYKELGRLHDGDEVIVPANTYIATILSITENRLVPVMVEPDISNLQIDDSLIEQAITGKTRAVMIVHLYGQCAYTERIGDLCRRYHLLLRTMLRLTAVTSSPAVTPSPAVASSRLLRLCRNNKKPAPSATLLLTASIQEKTSAP